MDGHSFEGPSHLRTPYRVSYVCFPAISQQKCITAQPLPLLTSSFPSLPFSSSGVDTNNILINFLHINLCPIEFASQRNPTYHSNQTPAKLPRIQPLKKTPHSWVRSTHLTFSAESTSQFPR